MALPLPPNRIDTPAPPVTPGGVPVPGQMPPAPPAPPEQVVSELAAAFGVPPAQIAGLISEAMAEVGLPVPAFFELPRPQQDEIIGIMLQGPPPGTATDGPTLLTPPPPQGVPPVPGMDAGPLPVPPFDMGMLPPPPVPGPPPGTPPPSEKPKEVEKPTRPVPDLPLRTLAAIRKASPYGTKKPTYEEIIADADAAAKRPDYVARNAHAHDQEQCYDQSQDWAKLDGQVSDPLAGEILYTLSRPTKAVDRLVNMVEPTPDRVVFEMPPRSDTEEDRDASQAVENWARDQFAIAIDEWWDGASRGDAHTGLYRAVLELAALHGTCGRAQRVDTRDGKDNPGTFPYPWEPVPWPELYPLPHATVRIQHLTLVDARTLYPEVNERWPRRRTGDQEARAGGRAGDYPADDAAVRIVGWSDVDGLWHAIAWDMGAPFGWDAEADAKENRWIKEPHPIDYGFCLYRVAPPFQGTGRRPWTTPLGGGAVSAVPDSRDWGRQLARGILSADLNTFKRMNQMVSGALTNALYNTDPAIVEYLLPNRQGGQSARLDTGMSAVNEREVGESFVTVVKNMTNGPDAGFVLSVLGSEQADFQPAVLGGRGEAASGIDRMQQTQGAAALHVEPLERWAAQFVQSVARDQLTLCLRYGTDEAHDGPLYDELPYRQYKGGDGYATLRPEDIERAGVRIAVRFDRENLERDLQLNAIHIQRFEKDVESLLTVREALGITEPEREGDRVFEEKAIMHPAMQETVVEGALAKNQSWLLPYFRAALERDKLKQQGQQGGGGIGSPPGAPGNLPLPGVPAPGLPPGVSGIPQR